MKTASYEQIMLQYMPTNPLVERRDYAKGGRDQLEQNAIDYINNYGGREALEDNAMNLLKDQKMIKLPMQLELNLRKRLHKEEN